MLSKLLKAVKRMVSGKYIKQDEVEVLKARGLRVGKNLRCHSQYVFDALLPWLITVGDNVCISSNVRILAHDTSTEYVNGHTKIGVVEIGDNVYIGYGVTILCNVRIGSDAIIGAGSVVTKDVPASTVYAGNPAKYVCTVQEFKAKHEENLDQLPVYTGPVSKWWDLPVDEKEAMRQVLKETHGYMK